MCEPVTSTDMEQRKHKGVPPNGEERRKMTMETAQVAMTWRAAVDWLVRGLLLVMVYFLNGLRLDMRDVRDDVTELRVSLAAVVQANQQQTSDITSVRSTDVALMNLLNEVTQNVAMLTERVNQTMDRVERMEEQ